MREKINRLAKGIIDTEPIRLVVRPQSIEGTVLAGRTEAGEIYVADEGGSFIKGLVYSSDMRVHVMNDAFGGSRSRISYEVDAGHLTVGDVISGAFSLVTNGGEIKVPYTFTVGLRQSGMLLHGLKTPEDFASVARQEPETALLLAGYGDFINAPFMQAPHIRTLYEGLKGRPDRKNSMEEFLVALKLKEPVELLFDSTPRSYCMPGQPSQDVVEVRCSTWGYTSFSVSADGDFLELDQKVFDTGDFVEGVCRVGYRINPSRLHAGQNLGALHIGFVRGSWVIRIDVKGPEQRPVQAQGSGQEDLRRYLNLRLEYELGQKDPILLMGRMKEEIGELQNRYGDTLLISLLEAELSVLLGDWERAGLLLDARRAEAAAQRPQRYLEYCFYVYLEMQVKRREGQREALLHLVKRYLAEEAVSGWLFLLWMKLEPGLEDAPAGLLAEMRRYFVRGCHSPFLYVHALRIYTRYPELLQRLDDFELQVFVFGARRDLLDQDLALKAAQLAAGRKHFHKLSCYLLILLYRRFHETSFLTAVCAMLIKGDCRGPGHFQWYAEALSQGVSLTSLYEYYLYTLPGDYGYLLPKEVLMYFSYVRTLDERSRSVLYMNILKYMEKDAPLYRQYERDMQQFMMDQLLKSRINRRLVVLYQHMLYKEMIDKKVARVLPSVLKSYRVSVENPHMKYVVVCYEELKEEDAYLIQDGVAYVPLFLEHGILLFQDQYGNRYSNISSHRTPAMEQVDISELIGRCYDILPNHPMLRLQKCEAIMEHGITAGGEMVTLRKAVQELPLRPLFRRRILSKMLQYHLDLLRKPEKGRQADAGYLLGLDPEQLAREDRVGICETLIGQSYFREAWELICRYGSEGVSWGRLKAVCSYQISRQPFGQRDLLLSLTYALMERGMADGILLDYLCRYYDGPGTAMYQVLELAVRKKAQVYDLPERLLAQMLFTGEPEHLDEVFSLYMAGGKSSRSLVKAYLTQRSADYFLRGRQVDQNVFACLGDVLGQTEDLHHAPTIYLLALGRHYAELDRLGEPEKELCRRIIELLIAEGKVFAWYKKLGRFIVLPDSVMDKTVLEYRASRPDSAGGRPEMLIRILPEESTFHPEELKKVYPGIYVAQKVLFCGETMEYQIREQQAGEDVLMREGTLAPDGEERLAGRESRYGALNEMCRRLAANDEAALQETMRKYLIDDAVAEELFPLM